MTAYSMEVSMVYFIHTVQFCISAGSKEQNVMFAEFYLRHLLNNH